MWGLSRNHHLIFLKKVGWDRQDWDWIELVSRLVSRSRPVSSTTMQLVAIHEDYSLKTGLTSLAVVGFKLIPWVSRTSHPRLVRIRSACLDRGPIGKQLAFQFSKAKQWDPFFDSTVFVARPSLNHHKISSLPLEKIKRPVTDTGSNLRMFLMGW